MTLADPGMTINKESPMKPTPVRRLEGEIYNVYAVYEELDKNEGRGGSSVVGYFHGTEDADEAAKDKGVFGTPGRVEVVQMFSMDGGRTGYVFKLNQAGIRCVMPGQKELKYQALAKLTDDEREALGL
jgi:hypothetical protein